MTVMTNAVSQTYWQSAGLPHLQLRETRHSTHAYKAHSHATFSIGAVTGGVTRLTLAQESSLLLAQGELVLIGPDCVHSCNPVDGRPRSYLMSLILDERCEPFRFGDILGCVGVEERVDGFDRPGNNG